MVMFMDLNLTVSNFVYNPLYNITDLTPERAPEYPSCLGGYRYSRFDFRVEKNCWEPAEHRFVFITYSSEVTDLSSLSIIFAVFRDFFTEVAIRLEN